MNLVQIIKLFCQHVLNKTLVELEPQQKEINRYMTLELCWIMTNIAHGPIEVIKEIFFDSSEGSYDQAVIPSPALQLIYSALQGSDLALQEIVLWLLCNCQCESEEISAWMLHNAQFISCLYKISSNALSLGPE